MEGNGISLLNKRLVFLLLFKTKPCFKNVITSTKKIGKALCKIHGPTVGQICYSLDHCYWPVSGPGPALGLRALSTLAPRKQENRNWNTEIEVEYEDVRQNLVKI